MNILITGAAGFLGREFLKYHLAKGDDVLGIDDLSGAYSYFPVGKYDKVRMDVTEMPFWIRSEKWDRVYHFAAPVGGRMKIERQPLYNARSFEIDSYIFNWLTSWNITGERPLLVYPSSSAVYGVSEQTEDEYGLRLSEILFEPCDSTWGRPDSIYGLSKLVGENLAHYAAKIGLNTLVIRPFSGYGEEQSYEYPFPSIMQRVARGDDPIEIWGSGTQVRDFVHVDDIVAATMAYIDRGVMGYVVYNIGTGVPTNFYELAAKALEIDGREAKIAVQEGTPEGVFYRVADTRRSHSVYKPVISLDVGIARVLASEMRKLGKEA